MRSGAAHSARELPGRGRALHTPLRSSPVRSGAAHCDPVRSGAAHKIWSSMLKSSENDGEDDGEEEEGEGGRGEEEEGQLT